MNIINWVYNIMQNDDIKIENNKNLWHKDLIGVLIKLSESKASDIKDSSINLIIKIKELYGENMTPRSIKL